jgi:hypothetical protein
MIDEEPRLEQVGSNVTVAGDIIGRNAAASGTRFIPVHYLHGSARESRCTAVIHDDGRGHRLPDPLGAGWRAVDGGLSVEEDLCC